MTERKRKHTDEYYAEDIKPLYKFQVGDKVRIYTDSLWKHVISECRYGLEVAFGERKVYELAGDERIIKPKYEQMAYERAKEIVEFIVNAQVGYVIGVKASAHQCSGHIANACYIRKDAHDVRMTYQVLITLPHPDPQHGELALVYEFNANSLAKI